MLVWLAGSGLSLFLTPSLGGREAEPGPDLCSGRTSEG